MLIKVKRTRRLRHRAALLYSGVITAALMMPASAWATTAAGSGGGMPWESPLGKLQSSISGPIAYALALAGVIGAGGALIFGGDMNGFLRTVIVLVGFIALLISAPSVLSSFSSSGAVIGDMSMVHALAGQAAHGLRVLR